MPFLPVGGQAVIEGVMMRSPTRVAVVVRHPDGTLGALEKPFESVTRRVKALGLPIVRTSVDHGTGFDIVEKGVADGSSLVQAMKAAVDLARSSRPSST